MFLCLFSLLLWIMGIMNGSIHRIPTTSRIFPWYGILVYTFWKDLITLIRNTYDLICLSSKSLATLFRGCNYHKKYIHKKDFCILRWLNLLSLQSTHSCHDSCHCQKLVSESIWFSFQHRTINIHQLVSWKNIISSSFIFLAPEEQT